MAHQPRAAIVSFIPSMCLQQNSKFRLNRVLNQPLLT